MPKGKVYIVGAGPGDPKLLTLRAFQVIRKAGVVVYDRLVSKAVLQMAPKDSMKVYVGKTAHHEELAQDNINRLLVSEAKKGKKVVRLKGGDPFIFGRGGEEAEVLRAEQIEFEVVPGLTSAIAVPAYAGIPITHRMYSSSVAIVTGHENRNKKEAKVKWSKLASSVDTIVILMGVGTLNQVAKELIKGGMSRGTPVAAVERGTTKRQKTMLLTLEEASKRKSTALLHTPSVMIVGKVAALAKELSWFTKGLTMVSANFVANEEN